VDAARKPLQSQRGLLADLKGRGAELGFLSILIAHVLNITIVKERQDSLATEAMEEEDLEFNAMEIMQEHQAGGGSARFESWCSTSEL